MKLGFQIKAKGKKKAEVLIYEEIGDGWFGGLSAKRFAEELAKLGKLDEINVRINSIGGSVFDGIAIYNTLRANGATIVVDIDGLAASIASVIAMAGDTRRAAANSMFMIHDPWTMTMGTAAELREQADLLDKIRGTLLDTYVRRTGAAETKISEMMTAETWFTAQEALDLGFVSELTEELKVAASVRPEVLANFRRAPERLRALAPAPALRPAASANPNRTPLPQAADGTMAPKFAIGDRIRVKGEPHMEGHEAGTVQIVSGEPTYGVVFDGMEDMGAHKWYVESEIEPEDDDGEGDGDDMEMRAARPATPAPKPVNDKIQQMRARLNARRL